MVHQFIRQLVSGQMNEAGLQMCTRNNNIMTISSITYNLGYDCGNLLTSSGQL